MSNIKEYIDYKKVFKNRERRLKLINLFRFVPTRLYLKIVFWIKTGKKLNLKKPTTFCDKLNYLKLHYINKSYSDLVDKIKAKDYIDSVLGPEYHFPTLGKWKSFDDINFDSLPDRFVLKCNHDSGSVKIIEKNKVDYKELRAFYKWRLKRNPYNIGREYPYKYVEPLIFAEPYMAADNESDLPDYKFFCFDGVPFIMYIASDRSTNCSFDFFDMDFNHLDVENIHPSSNKRIEKPKVFEEMKRVASILSKGMKFVRIDLYVIDSKVYVGEFTFFHGGGFWPFKPDSFERELGDLIKI